MDTVKLRSLAKQLHYFQCFDDKFVYNPLTMDVKKVSEKSWLRLNYIDSLNKHEVYRLLNDLGMDEISECAEVPAGLHGKNKGSLDYFSLCLILTHRCNLNCIYCFDKTQRESSCRVLAFEKAVEIINAVIEKGFKTIVVWFFGGEPLIEFELLKKITFYCVNKGKEHSVNFRFTITTNGTMLYENILGFLEDNRFSLMLSHDGSPDILMKQRPSANPSTVENTALRIDDALTLLTQRQQRLSGTAVRSTITKENISRIPEIFAYFRSKGMNRIYLCPVCGSEQEYTLTENDTREWIEQFETIVYQGVNSGNVDDLKSLVQVYEFVSRIEQKQFNTAKCELGRHSCAVDSSGELYACHRLIPRMEFGMTLDDIQWTDNSLYFKSPVHDLRTAFDTQSTEQCKGCWALKLCGSGGCPYINELWSGQMGVPSELLCVVQKRIIELACWVLYHLKVNEKDVVYGL